MVEQSAATGDGVLTAEALRRMTTLRGGERSMKGRTPAAPPTVGRWITSRHSYKALIRRFRNRTLRISLGCTNLPTMHSQDRPDRDLSDYPLRADEERKRDAVGWVKAA